MEYANDIALTLMMLAMYGSFMWLVVSAKRSGVLVKADMDARTDATKELKLICQNVKQLASTAHHENETL